MAQVQQEVLLLQEQMVEKVEQVQILHFLEHQLLMLTEEVVQVVTHMKLH